MVEAELTTVSPDVRSQINTLSAEVRNAPQEKPKEQPVKTEVPQPITKEQAQAQPAQVEQPEADGDDNDVSPKRKNRAQERIQELVAEKNKLKEELDRFNQFTPLITEYQRQLQEQEQQQAKQEFKGFETQEEFFNAVKEQAKKEALAEIEKELQPIKYERANNQYLQHINTWFDKNPTAKQFKNEMNAYADSLGQEERSFFEAQIFKGNTRPLELLYKAVATNTQAPADNSAILQKAIQTDQQRAGVGSAVKATRAVEGITSVDDDLMYAQKTRDYSAFIKKHLLG